MAANDTKPGMAKADRHVYGPRAVGSLVPDVTRTAFRANNPAAAQVMIDWPDIIGPALAAVTAPRRLTAGTLTIACSGPIAMELQHLALEVVSRINIHVGSPLVHSLRFVQVGAPVLPSRPPAPPPRAVAAAEKAVGDLPEGDLRAALVSLGGAVLSARKSPASSRSKR